MTRPEQLDGPLTEAAQHLGFTIVDLPDVLLWQLKASYRELLLVVGFLALIYAPLLLQWQYTDNIVVRLLIAAVIVGACVWWLNGHGAFQRAEHARDIAPFQLWWERFARASHLEGDNGRIPTVLDVEPLKAGFAWNLSLCAGLVAADVEDVRVSIATRLHAWDVQIVQGETYERVSVRVLFHDPLSETLYAPEVT